MSNSINLLLTATDLVSARLRSLVPQWKAQASASASAINKELMTAFNPSRGQSGLLGGPGKETADSLKQSLQGVSLAKLIGASAVGGIVAQGVTSAVSLGLQQIGNFNRSVMQAAKMQTSMLSDSADLSRTLGVSMAQAKEVVADTRVDIANIAAALPGETADYSAVFQALSATLGELNRGNVGAFRDTAVDTTKRLGFLASKADSSGIEAGSAVNRFIQGTATFGELRLLDVFQKNPMFQKAIRESAANLGLDLEKGFKNASTALRFKVIDQALKTTVTDDLIKEFDGTAEGYLQTLKTKLLDPDIGLFGFLRKVPVPGSQGRSVIDSVTTFLGNFTRFSEELGKLFPGFDPLLPLIQAIDILSGITGQITLWLKRVDKGFTLPDFQLDTAGMLVRLSDWATGIVEQINPAISWLAQAISEIDWSTFGVQLSDSLFLALGALGAVLVAIDWQAIGSLLYASVMAVGDLLIAGIGNAIGKLYDGLLKGIEALTGKSMDGLRMVTSQVARWIAGIAGFFQNTPVIGGAMGQLASGANAYADAVEAGMLSTTTGKDANKESVGTPPGSGASLSDPVRSGLGSPVTPQPLDPSGRQPLGLPAPKLQSNQSYSFSPTVSVSGTNLSDPQATADVVMAAIGSKWATFQADRLSK